MAPRRADRLFALASEIEKHEVVAKSALEAVPDRLRRLGALDDGGEHRSRRVFGAQSHDYKAVPATADDLQRLEALLGAALPPDFRDFLLAIGSGAGPYYGIYSAEEIATEWRSLVYEAEAAHLAAPDPAKDFPLRGPETGESPLGVERTVLLDGCVIIGHQGSGTQWSVLAISGDAAGTVWDLGWFVGLDAEWFPARVPPGVTMRPAPGLAIQSPPGFIDWYAAWLDNAEYGVAD